MRKYPVLVVSTLCALLSCYGPSFGQCTTISLPDSIKICKGSNVNITATLTVPTGYNVIDTGWVPAAGFSDTNSLTPTITGVTSSGYYRLHTVTVTNTELIVNGDFSSGNTGFTSSYTYNPSSVYAAGVYAVDYNPSSVHPLAVSYRDHTTGTGKMMIINGASTAVDVWCESIAVTPNTNYAFSAWFANWSVDDVGAATPDLQFKINGVLLGSPTLISASPGTWLHFYQVWNSGPSTTASICIYDLTTAATGNDFSIDDISFRPMCRSNDSVYVKVDVKVDVPVIKASNDTGICNGKSATLNATGSLHYKWTPNTGLSCDTCASPVASPAVSMTYIVTGTDAIGCTAVDTVNVSVGRLTVSVSGKNGICPDSSTSLTASGATNYVWSPAATLSCDTCSTITATPASTTTYTVTGSDSGGCTGTSSITVTAYPAPAISISKNALVCKGSTIVLSATGAHSYSWTPTANLNDPTIPNPTATLAGKATTYYVAGTDANGCIGYDSVLVDPLKNSAVGIPNAFSPNGDGVNDILYVRGSNIATLEYHVYNRWGQIVFETNNINTGWDGKASGTPQPMDNYAIVIKVTTNDGCKFEKKGNVTLLR
ncbi:MAG: gliding motility-associated C-terminal domain-containing protein [Taibaiella sp.]|nr:gliding motility-associated C-terminal domain-containing protein [Taibaiella sp.]